MSWIIAALWGVFGSFAVVGLDLRAVVRSHGCWPWQVRGPQEVGALAYVVAELIRLIIGGGVACAAATSGQLTTAFGALAAGAAAPMIVDRISRALPSPDSAQNTVSGTEGSIPSSEDHQQHCTDKEDTDKLQNTKLWNEVDRQRALRQQLMSGDEVEQVVPQGDQSDWEQE